MDDDPDFVRRLGVGFHMLSEDFNSQDDEQMIFEPEKCGEIPEENEDFGEE
jgi:hypothetical protein